VNILLLLMVWANLSHVTDQHVTTLTLLAEARGEGVSGMEAVAAVIHRRMERRGLTAAQVCLEPKQFSCWNSGRSLEYLWRSPVVEAAKEVASRVHEGKKLVADHYCTLKVTPYWSQKQRPVAIIGNHKFYLLNR